MDKDHGGSGRDDGGEHEEQEHRQALNNGCGYADYIKKIMMRITDALIKEEIRQRSILK